MNPVGVDIRHVALSFGATQVLKDISVSVEPGEFFALLGPSGSGKSTLLRLIAGFNQHQAGEVLIGGRDVTGTPPWKRDVGMVFQNYALWPHMTVEQNVAFGLEERRLPRAQVREKVAAALDLVGLAGYGARRPGQLSGGQQQRVAIARTLAIEPQVLLLDEPLSNLDAKLRVQTRQELVKLQRRLGITTIFVTHDQIEALTTCHRVAVMDDGVIQQVGTPMELFDFPVNRFVAQFVGSVNLFAGRFEREGGALRFASEKLGRVALPAGVEPPAGEFDLAFRPHAVSVVDAAGPEALSLRGAVENAEFLGEFLRYEIRVGEGLVIADIPHARGRAPIEPGTAISLAVPASELRFVAA
ncbi:MAG: ABC transporter ATP-binding protein [Burkholderiales bacterium]|nr:ABC transporter ATP-binding protein [Burkholderiales bacterium]MBZ0251594.1 ABC transporter ATP-binding protein [Burkholderiales bacterium]HQY45518.1 ABC transporter ATP-binding protein [Usitatibacteraceae bacterium]